MGGLSENRKNPQKTLQGRVSILFLFVTEQIFQAILAPFSSADVDYGYRVSTYSVWLMVQAIQLMLSFSLVFLFGSAPRALDGVSASVRDSFTK